MIFCSSELVLILSHLQNRIFFEFQKIPLTEIVCLRIVYAEYHQTIESVACNLIILRYY